MSKASPPPQISGLTTVNFSDVKANVNVPSLPASATTDPTASASQPVVNIAAYKFVELPRLEERRQTLRRICAEHQLKGTILLTPEGINLFLAGSRAGIDALLAEVRQDPALSDLEVKESLSASQPFARMLVKIKQEIIAFGVEGIAPAQKTSRKIAPAELRDWLDSGREVVLLDVRNDYEIGVGTFENAVPVHVDNFRDFPAAIERLPETMRDKDIVMFCTGGIRCEKAGPFMEQAGFRNVYQLGGGILKYFEDVGGAHYHGECFVFDQRVALGPDLQETETRQCYACLSPLSVEDQQSPLYDPPHACPHCHQTPEMRQQKLLENRQNRIRQVVNPLPGSVPYDNPRPLNVPARFDRLSLFDFVCQFHPHYGEDQWRQTIAEGRIRQGGLPVEAGRIVRAGEQFAHLQIAQIEPEVCGEIEILHEDDALVVVNKPAPLPMHPSGRFNRNSLQWILNAVYAPLKLRPAHRLDANTTGVVVCCKTRAVSSQVQTQFEWSQGERSQVEKVYLVRVQGHVPWSERVCDAAISADVQECGGRGIDVAGLPSRTEFTVLAHQSDGTSLLEARPRTGRTNQIRIHLWSLGFPVLGDPLYLSGQQHGNLQTLSLADALQQPMCLHARSLTLTHPLTGERVTYTAPAPAWAQ